MIPYIKFKDDRGRWAGRSFREEALACFGHVNNAGGWSWFRNCLAAWCLERAMDLSGNPDLADRWIQRYRAIRSIE